MNAFLTSRRMLVASALALLIFTGCQSTQMPLPSTFEGSAPLEATYANLPEGQTMTFGAYKAHSFWRIDTEAPRAVGSSDVALMARAGAQRYGFTLRLGDADMWNASCTTKAHRGDHDKTDLIACTLTSPLAQDDAWTLVLKPAADGRMTGVLQHNDEVYEVRGTDQTAAGITSRNQTGYLLGRAGHILACVELANSGRIWLRPSDDVHETTLLAALSATLLVTEDMRTV